ncbi:MAG: MiaB/RimO family radical SAM methylthiotransferase [Candidatus Omnitrophota bacterium]|nr:MAG: MiaB/RimO family radical SAM methylthiotransferase [Candidatus Omnitrophota bacterium]
MSKKTFSIISLGCFRNTYDSEVVAKRFLDKGYTFKKDTPSHCLIINTCGFISSAKEESLSAIRQALDLKRKKKVKEVFVFGCLVARYKKDLEKFFPGVDQWWGVERFGSPFSKRAKLTPSFIDFLKICEGCLNNCSYCVIPFIKGGFRSKPQEDVLREVKFLDKRGVRELNIIGQDITSWGRDLGQSRPTQLLKNILKQVNNIKWVRLLYTHPKALEDSLIDLIASEPRICKYIDLPIQHINDRILKMMNRKVTAELIVRLIKKIRKRIPGVVLRTSVIVGFPSETEKEFSQLLAFLKETKFDRLGAFIFSREEGTAAYNFDKQVHHSTKMRRYRELMNLQKEISLSANSRLIGKKLDVLVEEKDNNIFVGRTQYDAPEIDGAVFLKRKDLNIGDFYRAKIIDAYEYDLVGE